MTDLDTTTLVRLPDVEAWLDDHQVAWVLDTVDLADVDVPAGYKNQTRLDAINRDTVDRYTTDMEAGATFPPIILRHAGAKWIPVDGNHRLTAARATRQPTIAAYLIKQLTAGQALELAIAANRTHGLPLTDEERLWHALAMIHDGTPVEAAARAVGVAVDKLRRKVAVEKFTKRAAGLQMRNWADTSESARQILISIKDDRVFRRATRLVADRKVLAAEVGPLVARINASTAGAALDELSEIDKVARTRRDPGRPVSFNTSPRRRLINDLDQLITRFAPAAVADDCETDMARQQASDQIKAAARHLMKIEKQLWRSAGA
jgi:ParB-like chromosome segregation protein Spo0J